MKISPEFIPHKLFHKGIWLLPDADPAWYYFAEHDNYHKIKNRKFNSSVDEPLRELVKFLHNRKIITTPSCSGHDFQKNDFKEIYDSLLKQRDKIRDGGLTMTDIESGKKITYKDRFYRLPWNESGFVNGAIDYQLNGIIGLEINDENVLKKLSGLHIPGVYSEYHDGVFLIRMFPHLNYSNEERWEQVTKEIKNIFSPGFNLLQ